MQEALFSQALDLVKPWEVEQVKLDVNASRIDLHIAMRSEQAPCPACGELDQKVHDPRQRSWLHLVERSRLHPVKDLAKTIKTHWQGIVKSFEAAHLQNGSGEAVNSLIPAAKAKALGYGTASHFIAMSFLIAGKLTHLPACPFHKARPSPRCADGLLRATLNEREPIAASHCGFH